MYTLIVFIHVSSMIVSLVLMSGAVGLGFFGKKFAVRLAQAGIFLTITGSTSGGLLLLNKPLSLQCGLLASYLIVMMLLYYYGFAFGNASRAPLIRNSVQD